jgi:hypothetical protein
MPCAVLVRKSMVIALFALGGFWTAAVAAHGLLGRQKGTLAARLAKELQTGLESRQGAPRKRPE